MPREAPVTSAVFPLRSIMIVAPNIGIENSAGDLVRLRAALERYRDIKRRFLARRAGQAVEHRCIRWSRRDRVDADSERGRLERGGFGETLHGVLARGVEREIGGAALA